MEKYDLIIIGAGIAGCALSYNLKRRGYLGKILIIDKKEVGANAAYGYRALEKPLIDEYKFPYEHVFDIAKIGIDDKTYFDMKIKYYFVDYKKICKKLLKDSDAEFRKERAFKINRNILKTDKNMYCFDILVDCSGHDFFVKKIYKQKLPMRYFIGKLKVLKSRAKPSRDAFYHFNDEGYVEDLYFLDKKIIHGDWQYVKSVDFKSIIPPKKNLYVRDVKSPEILDEYNSVIPTAPVLPIVYKNIAFLGDSFGNSSTSAFGIPSLLESSKLLTEAIKNKDLKSYEKTWKKKYLKTYIKYLAIKYDMYHNCRLLRFIKKNPDNRKLMPYFEKHPEILENAFYCNPNPVLPQEFKKLFTLQSKIIKGYYYIYLRLKYFLMNFSM